MSLLIIKQSWADQRRKHDMAVDLPSSSWQSPELQS